MSQNTSFDPLCWRRIEIVRASRRMLMVFSTAPLIGTPKCISYMAGMFGANTDTCDGEKRVCGLMLADDTF